MRFLRVHMAGRRSAAPWGCGDQPRDDHGRFAPRDGRRHPRRAYVMIRLTADERHLIEEAAAKAGQSMTDWLVGAARAAAVMRRW